MENEMEHPENPDHAEESQKLFEKAAELKKKNAEVNDALRELKRQADELLHRDQQTPSEKSEG